MNIRAGTVACQGPPWRAAGGTPGARYRCPRAAAPRISVPRSARPTARRFRCDPNARQGRELVELFLNGGAVAVVGILDYEEHPEDDNARDAIGDELPTVRESENGSAQKP